MTSTLPHGDGVTDGVTGDGADDGADDGATAPVARPPRRRPSAFRRHAVFVLLVAVAFSSVSALYTFLRAPDYTASTLVQIDATQVTPTERGDDVDDQELATQVQVMRSEVVAQRVVEALQLDQDADDLQRAVTVEQVNDSRVLRLTATWDSPDGAATVANSFAEQYLAYRNEQRDERLFQLNFEAEDGVRPAAGGRVITPAIARDVPTGLAPVALGALSALLGLLVGVLIAYFRETRRSARTDTFG